MFTKFISFYLSIKTRLTVKRCETTMNIVTINYYMYIATMNIHVNQVYLLLCIYLCLIESAIETNIHYKQQHT